MTERLSRMVSDALVQVAGSGPACDHEGRVIAESRAGRIGPDTEAHLSGCSACRELHEAVRWMQSLADATDAATARRRLPEPGQLWWKAQLARRWEAEQRVVAPLDTMQRVEVGLGLVAAIVLLVVFVRSLAGGAGDAASSLWPALAGLATGGHVPVVALGLVVVGTLMAVLVRRLLLQD